MRNDAVYYYNINFFCNNRCLFCFSYNVGEEKKEIVYDDLLKSIQNVKFRDTDTVVINGGEPALSSYFQELLKVLSCLKCRVVIYSNGSMLQRFQYGFDTSNIHFVVPIHGDRNTHDKITQIKGSYDDTVCSLRYLQKHNMTYSIKFILNTDMVKLDINLLELIHDEGLVPKDVVLARMNITKKSKINSYNPPKFKQEIIYFQKCFDCMKDEYDIQLLDFPPCYLEQTNMIVNNVDGLNEIDFYYSDYNKNMQKRNYIKQRMCFPNCEECENFEICDLMSKTYYILKYNRIEKVIRIMSE